MADRLQGLVDLTKPCPLSPGQVDRAVKQLKRSSDYSHMQAQHCIALQMGFSSWAAYKQWYMEQQNG